MYNKVHIEINKWADDWNLFASEVLKVNLDPEQKEILAAVQHNKRVSVVSGTTRGKDYVAAVAALCFMYLTPRWDKNGNLVENTKIVMTAPTFPQIENIMFPEISRIFNRVGFLPGRIVGTDIRTGEREWFLTGFKAEDKKHEAWTGFHAVHVMYVITEASGISENIFSAIEGNIQTDDRILLAFNANTATGYAASSQKSPDWKKFRLDCLTAPNVIQKKRIIPGQIEYQTVIEHIRNHCVKISETEIKSEEGDFQWEGSYYRPNDWFRIKVRGMFPKVSEGVLVPQEWIEAANKRWKDYPDKEKIKLQKNLRLGSDIAGMGTDSTCLAHRYGLFVDRFEKKNSGGTANHMEVTGIIKNTLRQNTEAYTGRYAQAFLDTIGEGAGIFSRLEELKHDRGNEWMYFYSCKFSESASDGGGYPYHDITGQYEFINMRAYCYWCVRDWLSPENKSQAMLPLDDELLQELSETKWKFRSDGKIQLEEKEEIKKRIKRSPDKADSLALTFWPVNEIDPRPKKKQNIAQYFH